MKFTTVSLFAVLGLAAADKLPVRFGRQEEVPALSGPYAPSGWQPDGPQLVLPNTEYGVPDQEYGPPAQEYGPPGQEEAAVEVSEENIVFAGQSVAVVEATTASNEYLPPAQAEEFDRTQDPLSVQALPVNGQLNTGEFVPQRPFRLQQKPFRFNQQQQQQLQQPRNRQQRIVFQPSFRPVASPQNFVATQQRLTLPVAQPQVAFHKKHPKKPHFAPQALTQLPQVQKQQQFAVQRPQFSQKQEQDPSTVYGPPQEPQGIYPAALPDSEYGAPPQQQGPYPAALPESEYGAPPQQPEQQPDQQPESENNEESLEDDEDESELVDGPAVSVANAVSTNGQYYILGQDNVLQRVVYMTSQSSKDRQANGFTAKLQYAPVEPIRDPVYAYDQLGQLVRIYNK